MRRYWQSSIAHTFVIALGLSTTVIGEPACSLDPVNDRAIERLGLEQPPGPSEFHRAGQACTTCHRADGPADSDFSVAGTVFATSTSLLGVNEARIELLDAAGTSPPNTSPVLTNCVGNFWVRRDQWDPLFPIRVSIRKGDASRTMKSNIGQSGSCASCHVGKRVVEDRLATVAAVSLYDELPNAKEQNCPVSPTLKTP